MSTGRLRLLLFAFLILALVTTAFAAKPALRCRADGTFKVVMFSDLHHSQPIDPRTAAAMGKVLDREQPDMVIIAGDGVSGGGCDTPADLQRAIAEVAAPMEERRVPWAMVFGNHDQEHFAKTHLDKPAVIKLYAAYPHNLNVVGPSIHGAGNDDLLVAGRDGKPMFCLWLLDSGMYAPEPIGGYDWIHCDQVAWYERTSRSLEARYGRKVPGIMFFHIPLLEFGQMIAAGKFLGERNEPECPANVNSGLFAALLDRGDVKGVFCGHDHTNTYVGEWFGVRLGYDYSAGYDGYSLKEGDPRAARGRGGRVFLIKESDPWHFETWIRFEDGSVDAQGTTAK